MLLIYGFLVEPFYCSLFETDIKLFSLNEESILLGMFLYVHLGFVAEVS